MLKGTVGYQDGGLCEYSDLEVMQMLGRAGRPQFESSAVAIIFTRSQNKKRYEELGSGQQILESTLHKNLIEHLNSELSLGTFETLRGAKKWLNGTFLSVRLRQNPRYYSDLTEGNAYSNIPASTMDEKLERICEVVIENLRAARLVEGNPKFQPTEYGRAMSKYMIRFDTMKMILELPRGARTHHLLATLCEAPEFNEFRWQTNEKELFRGINNDPFIMYPIEPNVTTVAHKVSLLIQIELGHVELTNVTGFDRPRLRADASRVLELMHRLIRAVIECKGSQGDMDGRACYTALELARSMKAKAWEGKAMQLLQIPQIGPVLMRKLVQSNIKTVANLAATDASTIERIASRNPPYGKKMADTVACFPRLTLNAIIKDSTVDADGRPLFHIDVILGFTSIKAKWQGKMPIVTFLAVTTEGVSAYFWRGSLSGFKDDGNTHRLHFTWAPDDPGERIIGQFACEEIVGTVISTELRHGFQARSFPPKPKKPEQQPTESHNAKLRRVSSTNLHIDDDIEDTDLLGLFDNAAPEGSFGQQGNVAHELEDLFPMLDRDGNIDKAVSKPLMDIPRRRSKVQDDEVACQDIIRLPNGRYKCGHPCSQAGGGKTAHGQDCGHDCCRNGSKHPPKKRGGRSKKDAQSEDAATSMLGSVQATSVPSSFAKQSKISKSSNSKAKVVTSASTEHAPIPRASQSRKMIDLSAYGIDDDGLIDLTGEDLLFENDPLHNITKASRLNTAVPAVRRKPARPKAADTDYMLDDLSDTDFMDLHTDRQVKRESKQKSRPRRKQGVSTEYFDDAATDSMLEQADGQVLSPLKKPSVKHLGRPKGVGHSQFAGENSPSDFSLEAIPSERTIPSRLTQYASYDEPGQPEAAAPQQREGGFESQQDAAEPNWVNEFDATFIDEFRGLVEFI